MHDRPAMTDTLRGLLAVAFWSTTVAVSRDVIQQMGVLNAAFFLLLGSGLFLCVLQMIPNPGAFISRLKHLPLSYLRRAGIFLILYMIAFYLALGLASSITALLVVGLINYLWPAFGFILSIPLLKKNPRITLLVAGILSAVTGTVLALLSRPGLDPEDLFASPGENLPAYLLALVAAVLWGLYSNMTRRYRTRGDPAALPLLFLMSGLVILGVILIGGRGPRLDLPLSHIPAFGYMVIFPTSLAYHFWDRAMKQGDKDLVMAAAYLIPLFSTLVTLIYYSARLTLNLLLAAGLIVLGAVFSHRSVSRS